MNGTTEIIMQFGGLGALAVFFFFTLRWLLATMTEMEASRTKETMAFVKAAIGFTNVMENHIDHSTEETRELRRVIEDLRRDLK